ncbi:unnamed protein product [Nyctereutes procyonoides]|uniref:protein-serine/threonine phosphatase n=1 Tax=Nyctereutes procyonoides TaxID=34880 RepID=A0A811YUH3_NYCPR|nr:unnamed protein product [Nyctereutes procyonoides]
MWNKINFKCLFLKLVFLRGSKPGKNVQLQENKIRGLCVKFREILLSQPILLGLEPPLTTVQRPVPWGQGKQSSETTCPLLAYKIKYLENFFLLRGKHECASINNENDRGVSFTFGAEVVAKFLHKHDLDLICRAHQVVEDVYEFLAKTQLVTLFSAPNYCGDFDSAGAMMNVVETLMGSFQILKPAEKKKPNNWGKGQRERNFKKTTH